MVRHSTGVGTIYFVYYYDTRGPSLLYIFLEFSFIYIVQGMYPGRQRAFTSWVFFTFFTYE